MCYCCQAKVIESVRLLIKCICFNKSASTKIVQIDVCLLMFTDVITLVVPPAHQVLCVKISYTQMLGSVRDNFSQSERAASSAATTLYLILEKQHEDCLNQHLETIGMEAI